MPVAALALVALALLPQIVSAQSDLEIRLAHGDDAERETAEALRRLVAEHDLRDWVVTSEVLIERGEIPHSHPVLTLHTRHLDDDTALLATFLHEQFHWYVNERAERRDAAIAAFREIWPDVPVGNGEGARSERSTYLHLVVCDLEYQAVALLFGEDAARETLGANTHYRWIYDRVLNDPRVRETLQEHGLILD